MAQNVPAEYVLDPKDPRAPTLEQWEAMSPAERERVVNALPTSLPIETHPPEGDLHRKTKQGALGTLEEFFRRAGRRVYLSSELAVDYAGEPSFVPDVLAVLDVESHDRMRWVVAKEGRGLDFVLEVLVAPIRRRTSKRTSCGMRGSGSRSTSCSIGRDLGCMGIGLCPREQTRTHASWRKVVGTHPRC
jgi:hypothetical protein